MDIFDIKLALSRGILGDLVIRPSRFTEMYKGFTKVDKKLAEKIKNFEYNEKKAEAQQKQIENKIKVLKDMIAKADNKELKNIEMEESEQIINEYSQVRAQIENIEKIINLIKNLVKDECLEMIYDVRNPLVFFKLFFDQLKTALKGVQLSVSAGSEFNNIIKNIEEEYDKLIDYTIKLIGNDLKYFERIGVELGVNVTEETTIEECIKERDSIIAGIDKITSSINSNFEEIEKIFKLSKKKGSILENDVSNNLIEKIRNFRVSFIDLVNFCIKRVVLSSHIISKAAIMQNEKYNELEEIKKRLQKSNQELMQRLAEIKSNKNMEKNIKETDSMILRISSFNKDAEKIIDDAKKKDLKNLQIEEKEIKKISGKVSNFKKQFKEWVVCLGIVGSVVAGGVGIYQIPVVQKPAAAAIVEMYSHASSYINTLFSVSKKFDQQFNKDDLRYKIAHTALEMVGATGYVGSNVKKAWPESIYNAVLEKGYTTTDCFSYVDSVLAKSDPVYRTDRTRLRIDRMDRLISYYQSRGWKVFFVTKDLEEKSDLLHGATSGEYYNSAKRGRYPGIGKFNGFITGKNEVKDFQKVLEGKVALVSFNAGFHSAFILDGHVVQAHWEEIGGGVVEGRGSFAGHLSFNEKGGWEFAVVAIAPN